MPSAERRAVGSSGDCGGVCQEIRLAAYLDALAGPS